MRNKITLLLIAASGLLVSACTKAADEVVAVADFGTETSLTDQQKTSTIEMLMNTGLTREQAEAMLKMGDGTIGSAKKAEQISAMDPRASVKNPGAVESRVVIRFDGVDYPMDVQKQDACGDFFGLTSADFSAIKPVQGGRVSKFSFNGSPGRFTFTFWRNTIPEQFDAADADARFTIEVDDDVVTGFELRNGMRAEDLDADKMESFIVDGPNLLYIGPYSASSGKIISIDATYCPKK